MPATSPSLLDRMLQHGYSVVPFEALDLPHKLAIAHYMAIDGEAWSDALPSGFWRPTDAEKRRVLTDCMPRFDELYGDVRFGVALLPSQAVRDAIMQTVELAQDFASWDDYHAWYTAAGDMPEHGPSDRWPVLLADHEGEALQDGWHRVHCYLARGDADIPAVFYPRERHLQA